MSRLRLRDRRGMTLRMRWLARLYAVGGYNPIRPMTHGPHRRDGARP